MKITKILVALSFLFATVTANAGELTVTGNMEATYHTQSDGVTGNPIGMDRELNFAGSTTLDDSGITVSVMQDTSDNLAFGNSQISFGNIGGFATIYVGSDSDPLDGIDDITPTAYEEANGSGSGSYVDIGTLAGQMGLGVRFDVPMLGAINAKYYPKADGVKNADNSSSGAVTATGSGESVTIVTDIGGLLGALDGATLTTGYSSHEESSVANTDDAVELTAALTYTLDKLSLGYQKKYNNPGNTVALTDPLFYKDDVIGIAYQVNDAFSISYNRYTSFRHNPSGDASFDQETDAISVGYTVGGLTIGLQDATTDNAGYVRNAKDDTRTLGVSVAF
ncbi:hypothetical protein OAO89_00070 [Pelagibacteraceae bacterium]|nr:hypothetical protein [Pelagibacteraceae bacterium]